MSLFEAVRKYQWQFKSYINSEWESTRSLSGNTYMSIVRYEAILSRTLVIAHVAWLSAFYWNLEVTVGFVNVL